MNLNANVGGGVDRRWLCTAQLFSLNCEQT